MMTRSLAALLFCVLAAGCNSKGDQPQAAAGSPTPTPQAEKKAAGDAPCDQVVAKLASFDPQSGEAEKKLWGKMCPDMPPEMRACIVASKTKEERDNCGKNKKLH